jgi:hypothetical protein
MIDSCSSAQWICPRSIYLTAHAWDDVRYRSWMFNGEHPWPILFISLRMRTEIDSCSSARYRSWMFNGEHPWPILFISLRMRTEIDSCSSARYRSWMFNGEHPWPILFISLRMRTEIDSCSSARYRSWMFNGEHPWPILLLFNKNNFWFYPRIDPGSLDCQANALSDTPRPQLIMHKLKLKGILIIERLQSFYFIRQIAAH